MDDISRTLARQLFTIGDTRTTVGSLLAVFGIVLLTLLLGRIARKTVNRRCQKLQRHDPGIATTAYGVLAQLFVYFIGLETALHLLGLRLSSIFAASGLIAVTSPL